MKHRPKSRHTHHADFCTALHPLRLRDANKLQTVTLSVRNPSEETEYVVVVVVVVAAAAVVVVLVVVHRTC